MAIKWKNGDSSGKGHKKNPLYREHRLLPRKRDGVKTAASPPLRGKKENQPPKEASQAETGGPCGPEPTRYGDWERKGRCVDF
jgi:hypothetical protein